MPAASAIAQLVNVKQDIIPAGRPNRPGTKIAVTHITIHNTSNAHAGADAKAHAKFVKNTGYYTLPDGTKNYVSWHFTVDDGEIYQHLPVNEKGWHAGSGNANSIGIEICMNAGIDQPAANLRAATLVAALISDLGISLHRVVPHMSWTGKKCPTLLLNGGNLGAKWNAFIALVDSISKTLGPESIVQKSMAKSMAKLKAKPKSGGRDKATGARTKSAAAAGEEAEHDHELFVLPTKFYTKRKK